jgi:hypothetical protein
MINNSIRISNVHVHVNRNLNLRRAGRGIVGSWDRGPTVPRIHGFTDSRISDPALIATQGVSQHSKYSKYFRHLFHLLTFRKVLFWFYIFLRMYIYIYIHAHHHMRIRIRNRIYIRRIIVHWRSAIGVFGVFCYIFFCFLFSMHFGGVRVFANELG